jgi:hypothetical protein
MTEYRQHLIDSCWFMHALNEPIGHRANEDEGLTRCMAYVDNSLLIDKPIRAKTVR